MKTHLNRFALKILPVLACLTGCSEASPSGPGPGAPPGAPPPPSTTFSVAGTVMDSLTTFGVEGATVQIADSSTTSDIAGFYEINGVSAGTHTLEVISTAHQPFSAVLSVQSDTVCSVRILRLAPYLESLIVGDLSGTKATWIDLDGDFPSASWARFTGSGSVQEFFSSGWQEITPTARRYSFPRIERAGKIEVELIDLAGHRGFFTCYPAWICMEE